MTDLGYYKFSLTCSIITTALLTYILQYLTGMWLMIHIYLIFAYLIIISVGIYGLANKRDWAPISFLLLFATQAIDGFYLISITKSIPVMAFIAISILGLYKAAANADIYRVERKKEFFKVKKVPTKKTKKSTKKKSAKKKANK